MTAAAASPAAQPEPAWHEPAGQGLEGRGLAAAWLRGRPRWHDRPRQRDRPRGRHRGRHRRRGGRAADIALLAGGAAICATALTGLGVASQLGHAAIRPGPGPAGPAAARPPGRLAAVPGPGSDRPVPRPTALVIPSIGVRTRLIELGRTAAGTLQVPATTTVAGWFTGSPRPGAIGSSVIAGHVDSYRGPGIFFRLRLLRAGAAVYVRRADGSVAAFAVTSVHLYRKARFPTEAVYGPAPDPELRLITCGGIFDRAAGSYLSNVVVDAVAVRPHSARPGIVAPGGPFAHRLRSRGR